MKSIVSLIIGLTCSAALPTLAHAQCTPYTGSCGNAGQISCSEANAAYVACVAAQQRRPTGNVGPNNTKEGDPSVNTSREVKGSSSAR